MHSHFIVHSKGYLREEPFPHTKYIFHLGYSERKLIFVTEEINGTNTTG